jgi:predicted XRE-type DNA-binding protein
MAKTFDDLVNRTTSSKTRQRAEARTRELLGELLLSEIRKLAGMSQRQVADALGIKQASLSKLEKQMDMQISTPRRIVCALGGELEIYANFPNGKIKIGPFSETGQASVAGPSRSSESRSGVSTST